MQGGLLPLHARIRIGRPARRRSAAVVGIATIRRWVVAWRETGRPAKRAVEERRISATRRAKSSLAEDQRDSTSAALGRGKAPCRTAQHSIHCPPRRGQEIGDRVFAARVTRLPGQSPFARRRPRCTPDPGRGAFAIAQLRPGDERAATSLRTALRDKRMGRYAFARSICSHEPCAERPRRSRCGTVREWAGFASPAENAGAARKGGCGLARIRACPRRPPRDCRPRKLVRCCRLSVTSSPVSGGNAHVRPAARRRGRAWHDHGHAAGVWRATRHTKGGPNGNVMEVRDRLPLSSVGRGNGRRRRVSRRARRLADIQAVRPRAGTRAQRLSLAAAIVASGRAWAPARRLAVADSNEDVARYSTRRRDGSCWRSLRRRRRSPRSFPLRRGLRAARWRRAPPAAVVVKLPRGKATPRCTPLPPSRSPPDGRSALHSAASVRIRVTPRRLRAAGGSFDVHLRGDRVRATH